MTLISTKRVHLCRILSRKRYVNPYDRAESAEQVEDLMAAMSENNTSLSSRFKKINSVVDLLNCMCCGFTHVHGTAKTNYFVNCSEDITICLNCLFDKICCQRFHSTLQMAQAAGEDGKIQQGLFENYLEAKVKDLHLEMVCDHLCFAQVSCASKFFQAFFLQLNSSSKQE